EALVEDAAGIARVHVITWRHAYRGQIPDSILDGLSIERRVQGWTAQLGDPRPKAHTLIALDGDQGVGFCSVGSSREADADDSAGDLYAIYVDPRFMGKGIGSALLAESVRHLRADGFTHATLWVLASNTPSRHFYEHHGWLADGKSKTETMS